MSAPVAIITGASSGIGRACALTFAEEGYRVALAARSRDKLQEVADTIENKGGQALSIPTDVSRKKSCQHLIQQTKEKWGQINLLINNAGISMRALFQEVKLEVLEQLMQVNFWGAVYCTKFALPSIIETQGSIVGISSIAGFKGLPGRTGYSASKFAMQGFLESLRIELRPQQVHVMVVAPGFTASDIRKKARDKKGEQQSHTPLNEKKLMAPSTVSKRVLNGVQRQKRQIVLTRQGKWTVFLNKWMPGFMDKMVFRHFANEEDSPLEKE